MISGEELIKRNGVMWCDLHHMKNHANKVFFKKREGCWEGTGRESNRDKE